MNMEELKQNAYEFQTEFKAQVLHQINELNAIADGELQDGYNSTFVEDGWVSLEGYSWGFVMHYDEPLRIDMTFGPDWPFVGYKTTFEAKPVGGKVAWVNALRPSEICFDASQLARFGLRKLACKAGESWIFDADYAKKPAVTQEEYISENM